jgi:gamma-glutamyltranspeptidase / glutathione hydrolase
MRRAWFQRFFLLIAISALSAIPAAGAQPAAEVNTPTAIGRGGAAATVEVLATQAAVAALRDGANAVDAAVVAAAVLGVTEPFSCGIGGGGFMVIRTDEGTVTTIDHRETAPSAMQPDSFWEAGRPLPFNAARFSGLSAGVPGTVRGWDEALTRYGTMSLAEALEPAIDVAREGFVVDQVFFDQTQANVDFFDDITSTRALYLDPDGTPHDVGTVFRNPDLARAYERIAHLGAKGFYRGAIADAMVEAVQHPPVAPDANHVWRPGLMTMRDVKDYAAPERPPTRVGYRGLDVYSMGPPSSGGSTVGEGLNILEGFDLDGMTRTQALHLFLEASRFSFADRNAYLADPDFFDVPLAGLLSDGFAAQRRALIDPLHATASPVPPGDPYPFDAAGASAGLAAVTEAGETTTHITTSDRWGNVAAYTYTIESTGGNGVVVPEWGFLLNNELTDFNFDSLTHPNRVEGGKRPRSSMAPTIVLDDGEPLLALGSPGGSMIITTVLQILVDRLDLDATLPQAIAAPRASQRNTAATAAEPAFLSSPEGQALAALFGHTFSTTPEIGAATGIEFLGGGRVLAAAEPTRRGGGSALVEEPE